MLVSIIGAISNRIRGSNYDILFLNQDDINALLFASVFSTEIWHLPILYLAMRFGSATGWSEYLAGIENRYNVVPEKEQTFISKYIKIENQLTCFYWGCVRAFIWVVLLQLGLLACGLYSWWLWLSIPLFYVSYKLGYKTRKWHTDWVCQAELIWGALLWSLI